MFANSRFARLVAPFASFIVLVLLVAFPSEAQARPVSTITNVFGNKASWPLDTDWRPMDSLNDPIDTGINGENDFVGDTANPCAYYFPGPNYWYIRVRVHTADSTTFHDSILVLIDNNADGKPEYSFSWDSASNDINKHGLELQVPQPGGPGPSWATTQMDDKDGQSGQKVAPPDLSVPTDGTTGDGYVRTLDGQATTNFGTTTFVDFAVSWAYLSRTYQGAPITNLTKTQTWAIQLGSIQNANDHSAVGADVAASKNPIDSGLSWGGGYAPTAVTLSSFIGHLAGGTRPSSGARINLAWTTESEVRTAGFNIYRSESRESPYIRINSHLIPTAFDPIAGGKYLFDDPAVQPGKTYYYQLEEVELDGASTRQNLMVTGAPGVPVPDIVWIVVGSVFVAVVAVGGGWLVMPKMKSPS